MNRAASIIVGIGLVVLIGALVLWQDASPAPTDISESMRTATTTDANPEPSNGSESEPEETDPPQSARSNSVSSVAGGITRMTIASHNSRQSCWTIINGNVYDLTSWIPQHPGGEQAILQLCGTDGSDTFNGQHGGAPKQAQILSGFKIGVAAP